MACLFVAIRYNSAMHKPITTARRHEIAKKHNFNSQYLYQCLTGRRDMSPAEAMRLEVLTKKELTRQMLCQTTFAAIWPDLAKNKRPAQERRATVRRVLPDRRIDDDKKANVEVSR